NRADFLVKAPKVDGNLYLVFWPPAGTGPIGDIRTNTILKVAVKGDPNGAPTNLPTMQNYPKQPDFLADIEDSEIHGRTNTVAFSMNGGPGGQPQFYIDGEQFKEGRIDQLMLLDTAEEWLLTNSSVGAISHPFHIHINPFQVTEVYDPATMWDKATQKATPLKLPRPWIWWDVISIPSAVQAVDSTGKGIVDANGNPVLEGGPGYIKMRSRFVDFPGKFVLHCHILGHEDRGMM